MAEVARLDAILSADVGQFQVGMGKASESIINFSKLANAANNLRPFSALSANAILASKSVGELTTVLANLKRTQSFTSDPATFKAYGDAIKAVSSELKNVSTISENSFGKIGSALTGGLTSLRQLAYILPGIGVAGIFNLAFEAISEVVSELHLFGDETSIAAKYSADLNAEIGKENAGLNTELTKLSALVQVARDHSETLQARKSAITELQKEYPGYLSNINLENINSQEAANAIAKLTDALQRKALVQAYGNLLTKASEDLIKAQNSQLIDNVSLLDKVVAILKNPANTGASSADLAEKAFKNQAQSVSDLQIVVDGFSHTLADLTQQQAGANDFALLDPEKLKKAKKAVDELTASLKKDPFHNQIGVDTGSISDIVTSSIEGVKPIVVRPAVILDPRIVNVNDLANKLQDILQGIAQDAAVAIGEGIGNVISGKKNPFNALFEIIGAGVKELGKQLIIFSGIAKLVQIALAQAVINPYLALAAGVALEALGTVIANKGVQAHAEGGIFTKPTLWGNHLVGEAGPEALVPLSRMNEFGAGGGSNMHITGEFVVQGSNLVAVINTQNLRNNRTYGNNFNRRN